MKVCLRSITLSLLVLLTVAAVPAVTRAATIKREVLGLYLITIEYPPTAIVSSTQPFTTTTTIELLRRRTKFYGYDDYRDTFKTDSEGRGKKIGGVPTREDLEFIKKSNMEIILETIQKIDVEHSPTSPIVKDKVNLTGVKWMNKVGAKSVHTDSYFCTKPGTGVLIVDFKANFLYHLSMHPDQHYSRYNHETHMEAAVKCFTMPSNWTGNSGGSGQSVTIPREGAYMPGGIGGQGGGFKIEGHLGNEQKPAETKPAGTKKSYNLPFDQKGTTNPCTGKKPTVTTPTEVKKPTVTNPCEVKKPTVTNPCTEKPINNFRIDGNLGRKYTPVQSEVEGHRGSYNLPTDSKVIQYPIGGGVKTPTEEIPSSGGGVPIR